LRALWMVKFKICKLVSIDPFGVDTRFQRDGECIVLTFLDFLAGVALGHGEPDAEKFGVVRSGHRDAEFHVIGCGVAFRCLIGQRGIEPGLDAITISAKTALSNGGCNDEDEHPAPYHEYKSPLPLISDRLGSTSRDYSPPPSPAPTIGA